MPWTCSIPSTEAGSRWLESVKASLAGTVSIYSDMTPAARPTTSKPSSSARNAMTTS